MVVQRYYAINQGRFLTPDPYRASAGAADPSSWNRYAYVQGDPVNANDPTGLKLNFLVCGAAGDPYGGVDGCGGGGGGHFTAFPTSIRDAEGTPIGGTLTKVWFPDIYDGEGVSGGIASVSPLRKANQAAQFISEKATWSAPCEGTLAAVGTSSAALREAAGRVDIHAGDGSTESYASLYKGPASRAGKSIDPGLTIGAFFEQNPAAGAVADLNGNWVFIRGSYFDYIGDGYALAVIAHELLHNMTGKVDDAIQTALGLPTSQGSNNITLRILADCFMR